MLRWLLVFFTAFLMSCGSDFQLDLDPSFTPEQQKIIWDDVRMWDDFTCVPFEGHWKMTIQNLDYYWGYTQPKEHLVTIDVAQSGDSFNWVVAHELGHVHKLDHVEHGLMQPSVGGKEPVLSADDLAECLKKGQCCP